jgi:hypothetical protein
MEWLNIKLGIDNVMMCKENEMNVDLLMFCGLSDLICFVIKERCLTNKTQYSAIFTSNPKHNGTFYQHSDCQFYGG